MRIKLESVQFVEGHVPHDMVIDRADYEPELRCVCVELDGSLEMMVPDVHVKHMIRKKPGRPKGYNEAVGEAKGDRP